MCAVLRKQTPNQNSSSYLVADESRFLVPACHPDQALALLDDSSPDERAAPEGFPYAPSR